jgi:hypothetical protein
MSKKSVAKLAREAIILVHDCYMALPGSTAEERERNSIKSFFEMETIAKVLSGSGVYEHDRLFGRSMESLKTDSLSAIMARCEKVLQAEKEAEKAIPISDAV